MPPFRIIAAAAAALSLTAASLPDTGPIPQTRPDGDRSQTTDVPVPQQKPAASDTEAQTQAPEEEKQGPPKPPLTIAPETDETHQSCLKELSAMGAVFKDIPRIDDGNGCGIDKPIAVSQVLPDIQLKPEGTMRCETALALAHWMKESVIPSAATALPEAGRIRVVNQATSYICRLRNNATTGKISEHARGNAIDISGFTFENGKSVTVEPRSEDSTLTGAFQRTASASACLYFTTVLDPNSDVAHETHFHLDVLKRNGGFRYCH